MLVKLCCLILVHTHAVQSQYSGNNGSQDSGTNEHLPIDFAVVKDSTVHNSAKSSDGLPTDVNVHFDVLGRQVGLILKRNPIIYSAKEVYVIRKSESGIPAIVAEQLNENEVYGEYQDTVNGAIFTIACPISASNSINASNGINTTNNCNATLEGTFRAGDQEYRMSVLEDNAMRRVKRNAGTLWEKARTIASAANAFSKVYAIYKTENAPSTPSDFIVAEPLITGKVVEAFGNEIKTVREDVLPGGKKYNLEILAVIDYSIYERFYKASLLGTEEAKDKDAKHKIKKYFSHVFNGVDMLYKSINDPEFSISVAVSGFIIADAPEVSPWTTPHVDPRPGARHDLLVSIPLDELTRWSFTARNLPENDHIMLFTNYDLYSSDSGTLDRRTAGYARVSSVCSLDSVSVIEDHGGFQCINAAAHELGHGMGARHDGGDNSCDADDQFIMTSHGGFETDKTKNNPWRFSTCSIKYFKDYVQRLSTRNCLTDTVNIYDHNQYLEFISTYPGQDYNPNQQCQDILGLDSYYGWGLELGKFSDICTVMSCKVPGYGRQYRIYKAATGTSCGDKMWCIEGKCVFDEKAPTKDSSCVFGDIQRLFGNNQSCREYMLENPMRCYDTFYRSRCCDTCEKLSTGVRRCEYGDKFLNCRESGCSDPKYAQDCCSTCGLAPNPVIRSTLTTAANTRTTSAHMIVTTPWPSITTLASWINPEESSTTTKSIASMPELQTTLKSTADDVTEKSAGLCIRGNKLFLLVFQCSSLPTMFGSSACENPLVARYCCEKCPTKGETRCQDTSQCRVHKARECYKQENLEVCCETCKRFETNIQNCKYGDRIRSCTRYVADIGLALVCSRYKDYCCGICDSLSASTNNHPTIAIEPANVDGVNHYTFDTGLSPFGPYATGSIKIMGGSSVVGPKPENDNTQNNNNIRNDGGKSEQRAISIHISQQPQNRHTADTFINDTVSPDLVQRFFLRPTLGMSVFPGNVHVITGSLHPRQSGRSVVRQGFVFNLQGK